jgi:hypothetical protein
MALSAMLVAVSVMFAAAQPARAQNLVQDPNFSAGLTYYQNPYGFSSGATATTNNGMTGVTLTGGSAYGYVEQYPIVGYTSGVTYIFTFLAAAIKPDQPATIYAGFDPSCSTDGCNSDASLAQTTSSTTLTQFTVTGTATNSSGSYFYIEADGGGDAFVTGLNFEAAPAPVPGAGIMSFVFLLAGLATRRISLRRAG